MDFSFLQFVDTTCSPPFGPIPVRSQSCSLRRSSCDRLRVPPTMTMIREKFVSCLGAPCSCRVKLLLVERLGRPHLADRVDNAPGSLHFVPANEQRRVARDGLEQKTLVSLRRVRAEFAVVAEEHAHGAQLHARPGNFPVETKRNTFV